MSRIAIDGRLGRSFPAWAGVAAVAMMMVMSQLALAQSKDGDMVQPQASPAMTGKQVKYVNPAALGPYATPFVPGASLLALDGDHPSARVWSVLTAPASIAPPAKGVRSFTMPVVKAGEAARILNPAIAGLVPVAPRSEGGIAGPPLTGACCFPGEQCQETDADTCSQLGGVYRGDGTNCTEGTWCTETGQCCVFDNGNYQCLVVTLADCFILYHGFVWSVPGDCNSECPHMGACCMPGGGCIFTLDWVCEIVGGYWNGVDTTCEATDCDAMIGACCTDTSCTETTVGDCLTITGAIFKGPNTHCQPNGSCPVEVVGACCNRFGECLEVTPAACAESGGIYYGDETHCRDVFCGDEPEAGACCLADSTCLFTTLEICTLHGGAFQEIGMLCVDAPCNVTGACCMIDGTCQQLTADQCAKQGYAYQGDGTVCGDVQCIAPLGKCCISLNNCAHVTIDTCFGELGGVFWVIPGDCDDGAPCPAVGACCLNGACFGQTEDICVNWLGGTYHGDNSICTDNNGDGSADVCDSCPADIAPATNGNGFVNIDDLLAVINSWGPCPPLPGLCPGDLSPAGGNHFVNIDDLLAVINAWGPCP